MLNDTVSHSKLTFFSLIETSDRRGWGTKIEQLLLSSSLPVHAGGATSSEIWPESKVI